MGITSIGKGNTPRRSTSLESSTKAQMSGGFVGAIYVHGQLTDAVQIHHRDALCFEAPGALLGAGDRTVDLVLDLGQGIDEIVRRASGSYPDDGAGLHEFQRGPRHGLLLFVLRHQMFLAWRTVCTDSLVRPSSRTLLYTACPALRANRPK
jgi:hypothetical protein